MCFSESSRPELGCLVATWNPYRIQRSWGYQPPPPKKKRRNRECSFSLRASSDIQVWVNWCLGSFNTTLHSSAGIQRSSNEDPCRIGFYHVVSTSKYICNSWNTYRRSRSRSEELKLKKPFRYVFRIFSFFPFFGCYSESWHDDSAEILDQTRLMYQTACRIELHPFNR